MRRFSFHFLAIANFWSLFIVICIDADKKTVFQCDKHFDVSQPKGVLRFPEKPIQVNLKNSTKLEELYNLQCVYTFVARPGQRVMLEFDHFSLSGSSENCDIEYVDIYSEVESIDEDLLSSSLGGRYCGTVAPRIRISLHNIMKLILHSRTSNREDNYGFIARYSFISDEKYASGEAIRGKKCSYIIDSSQKQQGTLYSSTYPGTYPRNMHCSYLFKGYPGERVRLYLNDFDVFFGGEHCPYDSFTIFDGPTASSPIIKKFCGLQQRVEVYSMDNTILIHFNSTNPPKSNVRGFIMDYEFSSRFVVVKNMINQQQGVTHIRGTECDIKVESNRETRHVISSPNYPGAYPANTTCTYIIHGLQGDQNLEKVSLTFDSVAVLSYDINPTPGNDEDITCPSAWVGVATTDMSIKTALSSTDDSNFDATLCERIASDSPLLGPHVSEGPRMVVQFGSTDTRSDGISPLGFRAQIEFKTDFGITGESLGTSNECKFRFTSNTGFFNSPRYPANYPLGTICTYYIVGQPGQEIIMYYEQFLLHQEPEPDMCSDFLEIFDVFYVKGKETLQSRGKYCANRSPGPMISSFGVHEMRAIFTSGSSGSANGFKAHFEIRKMRTEDIMTDNSPPIPNRCGGYIEASDELMSGFITSPNYPTKYKENVLCDWRITVRPGYQITLAMQDINVEGAMSETTSQCQKAVIRVEGAKRNENCGIEKDLFETFVTKNNSVRISFLTAPDNVIGLAGFNLSWTEMQKFEIGQEGSCSGEDKYLCTHSKNCISSKLKCNGYHNCGIHEGGTVDESDEQHCSKKEDSTDRTVVIAAIFCGGIFLFICAFFCYLFKKKLERKKKKKRKDGSRHRQRQPYRQQRPMNKSHADSELSSPATSRFVHHDATGIMPPPIALHQHQSSSHTFYA